MSAPDRPYGAEVAPRGIILARVGSASVPLTRHEARRLRDELTAALDAQERAYAPRQDALPLG